MYGERGSNKNQETQNTAHDRHRTYVRLRSVLEQGVKLMPIK